MCVSYVCVSALPLPLRLIQHTRTPSIHIRTRGASPPTTRLLAALDLALVLDRNAAAATASLEQVGAEAALELVRVPDAGSLQHGEQPADAAQDAHEEAMAVGAAVA